MRFSSALNCSSNKVHGFGVFVVLSFVFHCFFKWLRLPIQTMSAKYFLFIFKIIFSPENKQQVIFGHSVDTWYSPLLVHQRLCVYGLFSTCHTEALPKYRRFSIDDSFTLHFLYSFQESLLKINVLSISDFSYMRFSYVCFSWIFFWNYFHCKFFDCHTAIITDKFCMVWESLFFFSQLRRALVFEHSSQTT